MSEPSPLPDLATVRSMLSFAQRLADLARPLALAYFRRPLAVEQKADESPVTAADRAIEAAIRRDIMTTFPDHSIYGEEEGGLYRSSDFTWVIDPIDGTKSFISGMPLFGCLIGLLYRGYPLVGVIDAPATGERWCGARGMPTTFNGAEVRASECVQPEAAILYSTSPEMFSGPTQAAYQRLADGVKLRRYGGDCYSFGLLASGFIQLVVEAGVKPYDVLPLVPILEGAGACLTDWTGKPVTLESCDRILAAANPELHACARALLSQ